MGHSKQQSVHPRTKAEVFDAGAQIILNQLGCGGFKYWIVFAAPVNLTDVRLSEHFEKFKS